MKRSLFIRYAVSYTLILLALFAGLAGYLVRTTQQRVQEEIISSQINRLTRIAMQHEGYISSMLSAAEEIGLSPHMDSFRYAEEPWKAYNLQIQLIPYTAINTFCDQMYVLFQEDDRLYSSSAAMTLERYARQTRFEQVTPEELTRMLREPGQLTILPAQKVVSELTDGQETQMVGFILPLGSSPAAKKGTLFCLVREASYQSLFSDAIAQSQNTLIFYGDQVLVSSGQVPYFEEDVDTLLGNSAAGSKITLEGQDWLMVSLNRRSWGMRYSALLPMASVSAAIRSSLSRVTLLLLGLLLFSVCMIIWMSRRHAKPIQEITDLLPGEDAGRRDALDQISTGIRQLTSSNRELSSRLEQSMPMQRHAFVLRFMRGRFATRQEAVLAAKAVGLEIDRPWFAVILCSIPEEWDRPFEMTQPPFQTLREVTAVGAELVAMKANLYLAFARDEDNLLTLADMIRQKGSGADGCITAISMPHQHFEEAPAAYLEAAAAYENRFVMGHQQVLAYADIPSGWTDTLPKARKITRAISQALTLRNRELLDSRISELLQFLKRAQISPFAFRMIYGDVIDTLTSERSALTDGKSPREFYDIFNLTSCQSIDDLDDLLRRLCDLLLASGPVEDAVQDAVTDEMDEALQYLQEHFTDPELSMSAIAESLELSTARLSLSFKEKVGMTPSEYLTMLRCQKARELLMTTELTVREIGDAVGYYDAGSFIRRFRQITGETPLQYRRARTKNN